VHTSAVCTRDTTGSYAVTHTRTQSRAQANNLGPAVDVDEHGKEFLFHEQVTMVPRRVDVVAPAHMSVCNVSIAREREKGEGSVRGERERERERERN
jgi:hypothetical protein